MAAQHRSVRTFAYHRSVPLVLNRTATLLIITVVVLRGLTGPALGRGGTESHERASASKPGASTYQPTSPSEGFGGCGRGRYRDPSTRKCRGPADFGN